MISYIFISVLILITGILLSLIVLVQNSKGGGLAANFQSSNQVMGVRKTADFLEKATWTLAVILLVFSLFSVFVIPKESAMVTTESEAQKVINQRALPIDAAPTALPPATTAPTTPPPTGVE